jgi:hypothetical protein
MQRSVRALVVAAAVACAGCAGAGSGGGVGGGGAADPGVAGGSAGGSPTASARFERVTVGMSEQQVLLLMGPPEAEGPYTPPLARALSVVGVDGERRTYFYKGAGRVLFTGGGSLARMGRVDRVETDPDEPGTER